MHNHSDKEPISAEEAESKRILERVQQESETVGTSSMGRVAERLKSHARADDADQEIWTEVWGTRIGRILGAAFAIGLIVHLVQTYLFTG